MAHLNKIKKAIAAFLSTAVTAASIPFMGAGVSTSAADDNNYLEALAMSLYFYDSNACGKGITDGPLTWRGDCHTYDAEASVGSLDGSLKSVVDPDGDGKVDVSGGWHDAGDHIKFNITIGFGLTAMGLSEYLNEGIYEKAGARGHLEYEMRRGAEYLMKTTFLDGSGNVAAVAGTVADGGIDHSIWTAPETQTYERRVYWLTSGQNNSAVCCEMASGLAASAYILKDSDPDFSAECIKYAKALLAFGTKNVGNNCDGMSFYSTDAQYQDEEAMTQAWLWILGEGSKPSRVPNNKDYGGNQYDGWFFSWDKIWQGYSALMFKATGDEVFKKELIVELNDRDGGLSVGTYNMSGSGWGNARYNCALQMDAFTIADGDPNSEYAKAAKWQMDYILGNNDLGYSFLLGYGNKWPTHIHHRAANPGGEGITSAQNPEAKYTNYGMLVGGIDRGGYQDHADKYEYTEGALDYNGCFLLACASCANLYGGDASAMPALAASASEINEKFSFGSSETPVVTTTTEATTTTTTTTTTTSTATTTTTACPYKLECAKTEIEVGEYVTVHIWNWDKPARTWKENISSDCVSIISMDPLDFNIEGVKPGTAEITVNFPGGGSDSITITVKEKTTDVQVKMYGDANCNGGVEIADAVLIMQAVANKDKFGVGGSDENAMTPQGKANADCFDPGSDITSMDALAIQRKLVNLIDTLPEYPET